MTPRAAATTAAAVAVVLLPFLLLLLSLVVLLLPASLAAATPRAAAPPRPSRSTHGVPRDGYPSYHERVLLVGVNRARADPNNPEKGTAGSCNGAFPSTHRQPQPPLEYNYEGSRCARSHCAMGVLSSTGLSHLSFCTLSVDIGKTFERTCDGRAECACDRGSANISCHTLGGAGTPPQERCLHFGFAQWGGEVGAAGQRDAVGAVRAWMTECADYEGHRLLLTSSAARQLGTGAFFHSFGMSATSCGFRSFFFGELSVARPARLYRIPSGVHYPETVRPGEPVGFFANFYDAREGPPAGGMWVVVGGECFEMHVDVGSDAVGTWTFATTLLLQHGCTEYYFQAETASGVIETYPGTGAFRVGADDPPCSGYSRYRILPLTPCTALPPAGLSRAGGDHDEHNIWAAAAGLATPLLP